MKNFIGTWIKVMMFIVIGLVILGVIGWLVICFISWSIIPIPVATNLTGEDIRITILSIILTSLFLVKGLNEWN
jgi:hypothetical protein